MQETKKGGFSCSKCGEFTDNISFICNDCEGAGALLEIERALLKLNTEKDAVKNTYILSLRDLEKKEASLNRTKAMLIKNIDIEKIALAEEFLNVYNLKRFKASVAKNAIEDILNDCQKLRKEYFGTKDYAQWMGQDENYGYGYGPRHGTIVFSIGLRNPESKVPTAIKEIEACIYFLNVLADENLREAML